MATAVALGRLREPVKRFVLFHCDQDDCWIVGADRGEQMIHGVAECSDEHTARVVLKALEARQCGQRVLEAIGRQRDARKRRRMTNRLAQAAIRRIETGQLALVAIAETTHIPDVARWLREDIGLDPAHAAIAVFKTEDGRT